MFLTKAGIRMPRDQNTRHHRDTQHEQVRRSEVRSRCGSAGGGDKQPCGQRENPGGGGNRLTVDATVGPVGAAPLLRRAVALHVHDVETVHVQCLALQTRTWEGG